MAVDTGSLNLEVRVPAAPDRLPTYTIRVRGAQGAHIRAENCVNSTRGELRVRGAERGMAMAGKCEIGVGVGIVARDGAVPLAISRGGGGDGEY